MLKPASRWFARACAVLSLPLAVIASTSDAGSKDPALHVGDAFPSRATGVQQPAGRPATYDAIRAFALTGGSADVANLVLKRDRVAMTFTGTFFFAAPVENRVTGAVFIGQGTLRAEVPAGSEFEKENVQRLLGADVVESDFKTAVLRMTDDTFEVIGRDRKPSEGVNAAAQRIAAEFEPRLIKETGINLSARLTLSLMNGEAPGVFFAQVDGGRRGRFSYVLDHQNRIPVANFGVNGGEKGVLFSVQILQGSSYTGAEIWMAFYGEQDYARNTAVYSDANDLVDVTHYTIDADLRDVATRLGLSTRIEMKARAGNLRAVPLTVGAGLPSYQEMRLKRQMRLKSAKVAGQDVAAIQEDWEGGLTLFLPQPAKEGDAIAIDLVLEGNFMDGGVLSECYYLLSNTDWLPVHGYLDRATFDLSFKHQKRHKIASVGVRLSEEPDPALKDIVVSKFKLAEPVAIVVFALGPFQRFKETLTWEQGGGTIPLEFYSVPPSSFPAGSTRSGVKEDFIMAELSNSVRYFAEQFGRYPYASFGAAFHPFNFGQGFPTLLMLPPADLATKEAFAFIAHETAHQWWGHIVLWRSYRDQWLSEGFAEYSGILYAGQRTKSPANTAELLRVARESLKNTPRTVTGVGKGRLNDIGPIILGRRLNTSKSYGAYQALIYNKGALVLRMMHYLFSNPTTGDEKAFFVMMRDFVERHRNGSATTEDFFRVAGEHFARTPIAQRYSLKDLNWFFRQWVLQTELPSYTLEYEMKTTADGAPLLSGVLKQDNARPNWQMPLPLVLTFPNNQIARVTVAAAGPSTPVELRLPGVPIKVELDPAGWILSEKTTTRAR
jgi:hypothetical protein